MFFNVKTHASDPWPLKSTNISLSFSSMAGFHTAPLTVDFMWHKGKIHHGITTGLIGVFYDGYSWAKAGPMAGYTFMTGQRNNHIELMIGVTVLPIKLYGEERSFDRENDMLLPLGQIGYRYQKPDGKMFFKIYFGNPGLGIGAGIRLGGK